MVLHSNARKAKTKVLTKGVGRGGSKGSDEPPLVSNQDLIIASYLGSFNTKPSQV